MDIMGGWLGLSVFFIAGFFILWKDLQEAKKQIKEDVRGLEQYTDKIRTGVREEIALNREEALQEDQRIRKELRDNMDAFSQSLLSRMTEVSLLQKNQLDTFSQQLSVLTQMNEQKLEKLRAVVEERLRYLQEENNQRLEKMRETVDEKLHATLEKRLGDSFQIVSDRLEKVHQGLGEMQSLAAGVGDLKKVLANVKTRGTWGEVQLGNLLEQMMSPDQYEKNVVTKTGSRDPVEFAIKLPGGQDGRPVYLPIDAKFPLEDYERLQEAQDQGDGPGMADASKALENRIKLEAKNIREKYLDPPRTTDFGIMFLPTESLYAEVLRRPGFLDLLRREARVMVAGPTTIAALLNSLQMGFRTLAVEKRASEVWNLLGLVKNEFSKFGGMLEKTHKKLQEASNTIETAAQKSRTIERKLQRVQEMPGSGDEPQLVSSEEVHVSLE
ncbi:MAG TPA: DNA recombination protein RmuC [Candidatus Omnitrophota bacterium]|nr:DNA recombination protein RmuC [Candidatus Omnitrophota bacterium]HPB68155.1 DNA recombination protein RmuC [Candidatus Omnitrophota bacterium]HQO57244.1 DNA recombination protein RmuC [Candidatus Omnitrophota bacterium]